MLNAAFSGTHTYSAIPPETLTPMQLLLVQNLKFPFKQFGQL